MLSKAQNKYIRSLSQQKYREEHGVFVVEGDKIAAEWLNSDAQVQLIVGLQDWIGKHKGVIAEHTEAEVIVVEEHHLEAITQLQTPNKVLLVVHQTKPAPPVAINDWCIVLDTIQDPGNMGTIIRIADWFGIKDIISSFDSVDYYNHKVIQAAMGGHLRVSLHTADLSSVLKNAQVPIYAAVLEGDSIYKMEEAKKGIILIGNESKGVSETLQKIATHKITIPRRGGAESLNAGVSVGIICALLIKA